MSRLPGHTQLPVDAGEATLEIDFSLCHWTHQHYSILRRPPPPFPPNFYFTFLSFLFLLFSFFSSAGPWFQLDKDFGIPEKRKEEKNKILAVKHFTDIFKLWIILIQFH